MTTYACNRRAKIAKKASCWEASWFSHFVVKAANLTVEHVIDGVRIGAGQCEQHKGHDTFQSHYHLTQIGMAHHT
jgi:hypothetical protein